MKNFDFDNAFERQEKRINGMFKLFAVIFVLGALAVAAVWGGIAYLVVSKGPETVQRVERITDAYADKLEQQNKNNKPE